MGRPLRVASITICPWREGKVGIGKDEFHVEGEQRGDAVL